jgi:5-methylcytosine-specific restriction enzyme subunit McrC
MRLIELWEHRPTEHELAPGEVEAVRTAIPGIRIDPVGPGRWCLRPQSTVGVAVAGDLQVVVHPKMPIERLLFLLSYAARPDLFKPDGVVLPDAPTIVEAMAEALAGQMERALARGLRQGYRRREDRLMVLRGRVRFGEQLHRHWRIAPPLEVTYDEFTVDTDLNRVLLAALVELRHLPLRSRRLASRLRQIEARFARVAETHFTTATLPTLSFDRLNRHWEVPAELAKLIIRGSSIEGGVGTSRGPAFLLNMNKVFEDFVVVALREAFGLRESEFPQGGRHHTLWLDEATRVALKPDFTWWSGGAPVLVGDAKYIRVNAEGVLHPNLYQVLAYTVATGLSVGWLVYAAGTDAADDPADHEIVELGKRLIVRVLDVSGSPAVVLRRVDELAAAMRAQPGSGRERELV